MVLHLEINQRTIPRRPRIREEAETLRSELENELEPDQYQAGWEKGFGEEVDDIVIRILAELDAQLALN